MLPKRPARQDLDTLTWEYLDGDISPSRAATLSQMIVEEEAARKQFVESQTLHRMLQDYFQDQQAQAPNQLAQSEMPPRRGKRRRTSAA